MLFVGFNRRHAPLIGSLREHVSGSGHPGRGPDPRQRRGAARRPLAQRSRARAAADCSARAATSSTWPRGSSARRPTASRARSGRAPARRCRAPQRFSVTLEYPDASRRDDRLHRWGRVRPSQGARRGAFARALGDPRRLPHPRAARRIQTPQRRIALPGQGTRATSSCACGNRCSRTGSSDGHSIRYSRWRRRSPRWTRPAPAKGSASASDRCTPCRSPPATGPPFHTRRWSPDGEDRTHPKGRR